MGAQSGIVWCEALPQAEETLIADDFQQHIQPILVFWLPINHPHILDPSFDDVHRHGSSSGNEATDHAGAEVAENIVREVAWEVKQKVVVNSQVAQARLKFSALGLSPESSKNCLD